MEELLNTLKQLEKDYEEAIFMLIEIEKEKEVIEKKKREIAIKLYQQRELIAEKKLIDYLNDNGLVLYKYTLSLDYIGCDTTEYVLIPKEVKDVEAMYSRDLDELALDNLHSYGYLTDEEYYQMADDLDIDLEDEEAVENSDLVDYDYSDYCWDIEKVEDLSEVIGHIDLDDIEEWR